MPLQCTIKDMSRGVLLLTVDGSIDLSTVKQWEDVIRRIIRRRIDTVVVDVKGLEHISARGLKMLLACAANQSLMNGCLVVVGGSALIRRMAKLVGLWDLAIEAHTVRSALRKAAEHKSERAAGEKMLRSARAHSQRLTRQAGRS